MAGSIIGNMKGSIETWFWRRSQEVYIWISRHKEEREILGLV